MGVAADLLKTDVSNRFGQIWDAEYQRLIQTLDSRKTSGTITIEGTTQALPREFQRQSL